MGIKSRTGAKAVHWYSSPACGRYLEHLECRGDASADQLASACHSQVKYALNLCRKLLSEGVIRVIAWRHNCNGAMSPIYRLGPGTSIKMPQAETAAKRYSRRRRSLVAIYGKSVATRVLDGKKFGHPIVVIDGKRVTSGSHASHLAGKVDR